MKFNLKKNIFNGLILKDLSKTNLEDIQSLFDFVNHTNNQLTWINEAENSILKYNWSDEDQIQIFISGISNEKCKIDAFEVC